MIRIGLLLSILLPLHSLAQKEVITISGYIYDSVSIEPLVGAHIVAGKESFTTSNINGFYRLSIDKMNSELEASYSGYQSKVISVSQYSDTTLNFYLNPGLLDEVIISDQKDFYQPDVINIPIKTIKALPSLGGEVDVLKSLTLFPGVSPGLEGTSEINVRGGSPDQNLILLDDAPVYNVSHLFGFVSAFNATSVKNVELLKGGIPARYGGRLSSIINISMTEGNKREFSGEVTLGLISSKLTLEIPLIKEKTSLFLAGRSSYLDLITLGRRIAYNNGEKNQFVNYSMWDGNAKIHHLINDRSSISLSHYSGRDQYSDFYRPSIYSKYESSVSWQNNTTTLRYNHLSKKRVFYEGIVYHTRYKYNDGTLNSNNSPDSFQNIISSSGSSIEDLSAKFRVGLNIDNHHLIGGFQYIYHRYTPSNNQFSQTDGNSQQREENIVQTAGRETAIFIEDEWKLLPRISLNKGLRHSAFFNDQASYSGFEPRIALNYKLNNRYTLSGSYTSMRQYVHLITSNTVGLPNDIWVPVTENAPPERSDIWALGLSGQVNEEYSGSVEVFYKRMHGLIGQREGENPTLTLDSSWDELIVSGGTGEAYGLEVYAEKSMGRLNGWLSYTLSWNHRLFDELNNGNRYPYRYDRRHQFSAVGKYKISDKWSLSGNWVFMSGHAVTAPVSRYLLRDNNGYYWQVIVEFGDRNNGRMPPYHRLDLQLIRKFKTKQGREAALSFGFYNVYMRRNPLSVQVNASGRGGIVNAEVSGKAPFIMIPSISYTLKF
ncbi:MAG: TonB-dependent receptor domain-containing protein [Bacteroidota bacterium]